MMAMIKAQIQWIECFKKEDKERNKITEYCVRTDKMNKDHRNRLGKLQIEAEGWRKIQIEMMKLMIKIEAMIFEDKMMRGLVGL